MKDLKQTQAEDKIIYADDADQRSVCVVCGSRHPCLLLLLPEPNEVWKLETRPLCRQWKEEPVSSIFNMPLFLMPWTCASAVKGRVCSCNFHL